MYMAFKQARDLRLAAFEIGYLVGLLQTTHGDVSEASRQAALPRGTLYRLLKKHDIHPQEFRKAS